MYDIEQENGGWRTQRSPKKIKTKTGLVIEDATAHSRDFLTANGVYEVKDQRQVSGKFTRPVNQARTISDGFSVWTSDLEPVDLDTAKATLRAEVKATKEALISAHFEWERAPGVTHLVQIDNGSMSNLTGAYNRAKEGSMPAEGEVWRMADNSGVLLTKSELCALYLAASAYRSELTQIQTAKDEEVNGLPDVAACEGYDAQAGFPPLPDPVE